MSEITIDVEQIHEEISKELKAYETDVQRDIDKAAREVAEKTVERLKSTSPKERGDYAAGWTYKMENAGDYIVHNATNWQLTHLLEKGHVKANQYGPAKHPNGGARTKAKRHIKPAEREANEMFQRRVEEALNSEN